MGQNPEQFPVTDKIRAEMLLLAQKKIGDGEGMVDSMRRSYLMGMIGNFDHWKKAFQDIAQEVKEPEPGWYNYILPPKRGSRREA